MGDSTIARQASRENGCDGLHWLGGTVRVIMMVPTDSAELAG